MIQSAQEGSPITSSLEILDIEYNTLVLSVGRKPTRVLCFETGKEGGRVKQVTFQIEVNQSINKFIKVILSEGMGCEQSDIAPFVNAFNADSENSERAGGQNLNNRPQQQNYHQPPQQHQYPPQQLQKVNHAAPPSETQLKMNAGKKVRKLAPREHLQPQANLEEDYLTHHLKYELSLTKMTSMKRIRRRQLVEHLKLQVMWGNIGGIKDLGINFQIYEESLMSAWIQRTFTDIWQVAHDDLFVKHLQPKIVRRKVSEQFMFQLFEIKEYIDSGLASISFMLEQSQIPLFSIVQSSDEALYNIFQKLKQKYPQTSATDKIEFPDVPSTKTNMNLLDNFDRLCFTDFKNMNYQTIYEDLNFLFKKAIEEEKAFKEDMQDILGEDVLACPKVGQVTKDGKTTFNACAVRRVFVKWAENLLQKLPELKFTKTFMKFIKARSSIINNFFFKSTIAPTTHKIVIDCISLLLQLAKFDEKGKIRQEFIFNIYDLLRCKIKRNTPEEIVKLLQKMQSTKTTKNGKKFQVLRVKNRFKTNNRDLLINFKYGDVLVGEAQLCIDNANLSKQAKLNYQFCHYIYELERSLFGPTLELMMQYEDFQRPDITVSFQAEDLVPPRKNESIKNAGPVKRRCLQGHEMISLQGNFFFDARSPNQTEEETIAAEYPAVCNFCARSSTVQDVYDYCYQCGCFLCKKCSNEYEKVNTNQFWLSIQKDELMPVVKTYKDLQSLCEKNKSMVVLFRLQGSSSSDLFKDSIIYNQAKLSMIPNMYTPKIALINYENNGEYQNIAKKCNITDYPSLVLFDANLNPIRKVIGFSWFEAPNLFMTQKLLIEGKKLDLDIYCAGCDEKMEAGPIREDGVCLNCFNVSQPINLNPSLTGFGAFCSQGHYRCMNCSYAALECPSTYKDGMGGHYLSTNWVAPKLVKCPKGHQTKLVRRDPKENWQYTCFMCKKKRFIDDEHGIGQCGQCDAHLCPKCMGAPIFSFTEMQSTPNMVRHYVESTAEQAVLCICSRHFKKSYCSRIHSLEQIQDEHSKKWKCFLCTREGNDGQLHIGCFACPVLSELMGHKFNFEICMPCATRSKMIMREPAEKVEEIPSLFTCPKDSKPMVETSFAYHKKLVVQCYYCKKNYFGNTERYYCKTCDLNCCMNCREQLWKGKPPRCRQRCSNGHELIFKFADAKGLDFCDGCSSVLRDECFKCADDDYTLCKECVTTKPPNFVGTILKRAREAMEARQQGLEYEQVKGDDEDEEEEVYDDNEVNYGQLGPGYEQQEGSDWGIEDFLNDF